MTDDWTFLGVWSLALGVSTLSAVVLPKKQSAGIWQPISCYHDLVPFLIIPLVLVAAIAFVPVLFVLRFRLGGLRRRARPVLTTLNLVLISVSAGLLLVSASIVNVWVSNAFKFAVAGLVTGSLLSMVGLAATRWERTAQALFYAPNRWFALLIPLALTLRIIYWMWRGWHVWAASPDTKSWLAASGTAGSLGIGAIVAGYYWGYAAGVWRRSRKAEN